MSNIEKIRQEIERLENMDYPCDTSEQATGFYNALDCLSDFIDSLPEEKQEWSEEDEKMLNEVLDMVTYAFYEQGNDGEIEDNPAFLWLHRLRLSWKPGKVCYGPTGDPDPAGTSDLEEAADNHIKNIDDGNDEWSLVDVKDAFIAGAEWQARQLLKGSPLPEDTVLFQKGVEEGKRLMMEDAVEGEIVKDITNKLAVTAKNINLDGFKFGDKVKIIIVKQ